MQTNSRYGNYIIKLNTLIRFKTSLFLHHNFYVLILNIDMCLEKLTQEILITSIEVYYIICTLYSSVKHIPFLLKIFYTE